MNIRLVIMMAAMLIGASLQASAATNGWTAIGPSGGTVIKIVYNHSTPSTVYAIATGGFYRSLDGGVSWQLIKSDFMNAPEDLAIDPSDATRVYVVAPNYPSLYVSTDGGATLTAVTTIPTAVTNGWQVAVSQNGMTIYVTSGMQVFCSTDRANTWQQRTSVGTYSAAQVYKLLIDPTDSNTLYATATTSATDAGIFASHDGAMTWQLLTSGSEATSLPVDLAINAANSSQLWSAQYNGVWFSSNKGVNWTNMSATVSSAIAIDPLNPSIVYAGTPGGSVFRTADAGVTWIDVTGNNSAGQFNSIAVNPSQDSQILTGGYGGLSGTATSGTQWSTQTAGLNSTSILGLSADPSSDRIYMNVSSGGVYYSAAGAAATTAVNNVGSGGLLQLSGPTLSVWAVLAQPGLLSASLIDGLARSTDGGATWSLVPFAVPNTSNQVSVFASSAANPQTIIAATSSTLYLSTDEGQLWTQQTTGLPANAVVGKLVAAASDPNIFYASVYTDVVLGPVTNFGVYKSSNAGQSWAPANAGIASSAIGALVVDPTNASLVYIATDSAALKSIDGGATWNPMTSITPTATGYPTVVAIDPKHPSILYAGGASGQFVRSVDGGTSWQSLRASGALPYWSLDAVIADPNRPENILVATEGSGVQQFTVAPDLSLRVAAPASPVAVGIASSYTYTVSNLGPFDATGVRVSLQLPATAQSISAAASDGTCTVAGSVATCVFGIARAGASSAITLKATAPAAGPFQLVGSVIGDQPDPVASNNTVATSETVATIADLSVTASGSATAQVGSAVSYTLVVANAGPNVAASTQLKYQLAQGLTPGTATSSGGTCTSSTSGLVTCLVGDLAAAKSATITISATATAAGTLTSAATVSSAATDLTPSNNSATNSTTVTTPPPVASVAPSTKGGGGSFSINNLLMLALMLAIQKRALWTRRGGGAFRVH
jgi:uncharacterized repeat protein (TIGR01451 family)